MAFPISKQNDLHERFIREGVSWPMFSSTLAIYWSGKQNAGGQQGPGPVNTAPTKGYYMTGMQVTANVPVTLQAVWGYYVGVGNYPTLGNSFIAGPSGAVLPFNGFIRARQGLPGLSIIDFPQANPMSTAPVVSVSSVVQTLVLANVATSNPVGSSTQIYTSVVTITNNSGATITNPSIDHEMPVYYKWISTAGANFASTLTGNVLTTTYTGTIANGASVTFTYTGRATRTININISLTGYQVDNDINFTADPMYIYGTSISVGAGIPTDGRTSYIQLFRNWLRDVKNVNVRYVNKAISGTSTRQMEELRLNENWYDFYIPARIFIIEEGINEAVQNVPNSETLTNYENVIKQVKHKAPKCKILILAPFPTGGAPDEAKLVTLDTAIKAWLPGFKTALTALDPATPKTWGNDVYYVDTMRTLWNAATQSGTYTTDGIHLNAAAMLLVESALETFVTSNNIQF